MKLVESTFEEIIGLNKIQKQADINRLTIFETQIYCILFSNKRKRRHPTLTFKNQILTFESKTIFLN